MESKLLNKTLSAIEPVDEALLAEARRRLDKMAIPNRSLGRLERLAQRVVAITGNFDPPTEHKVIITMAGDHGVVAEGVSAFPQEVTPQMVENFLAGSASINVLARHVGARVEVVDMGVAVDLPQADGLHNKKVGYGTRNFAKEPAMSREEAVQSVEAGIEMVNFVASNGLDIVGTGDMGIGNTTPSSAIIAVLTGRPVREVTGRGTGINDEVFERKVAVVEKGIELNQPDPSDPLDVLAKVGGFEIGGIAGVVLGAAALRVPVVVDGLISAAGALVAAELASASRDYMFGGHQSVEIGQCAALEKIGIKPLLNLDMRLGEGTGAALGISLIEAGVKILKGVATFDGAGVTEGDR